MQTILGAGGSIGLPLAKALSNYTTNIRLVSRNPSKVNQEDQVFPADLTDPAQVMAAVAGSEIVYLVVGFEYSTKVWRKQWPALMKHVIEACSIHHAKLVFFDNVYMYDKDYFGNLTEDTPVKPSSKKGAIRAEIASLLLNAVKTKRLDALIARAADFFGPDTDKSILGETVYKNYKQGKSAMWFGDANRKHSFTYTLDAARATALLGNTADAYNQVWHLPTHAPALTVKEWMALFAEEIQVKPKYIKVPLWVLSAAGAFVPFMKELAEMSYQYDRDYVFNSNKYQTRFHDHPTGIAEAIKATMKSLEKAKPQQVP